MTCELTEIQFEALKFESKHMDMSANELMAWMVRQNILPLLDVMEANGQKQRLVDALQKVEDKDNLE